MVETQIGLKFISMVSFCKLHAVLWKSSLMVCMVCLGFCFGVLWLVVHVGAQDTIVGLSGRGLSSSSLLFQIRFLRVLFVEQHFACV